MKNKHCPTPWYWRDNRTRIHKGEFIAHGGLSNPKLFRKADSRGCWTYWRLA